MGASVKTVEDSDKGIRYPDNEYEWVPISFSKYTKGIEGSEPIYCIPDDKYYLAYKMDANFIDMHEVLKIGDYYFNTYKEFWISLNKAFNCFYILVTNDVANEIHENLWKDKNKKPELYVIEAGT